MSESSRRKFLAGSVTGASAALVAANWPAAAQTAAMAQQSASDQTPYAFFTPAQAIEIEAMAEQIFPTTDTPGAKEANAIYFIDMALVTFAKSSQDIYTKGLNDLQTQTKTLYPDSVTFSTTSPAQHLKVLAAMEKTPFFQAVRTHTIMGVFAAPQHGGNHGEVGWKLIGFDNSLNFKPPFGAYDNA
jgi:hypothetical protein